MEDKVWLKEMFRKKGRRKNGQRRENEGRTRKNGPSRENEGRTRKRRQSERRRLLIPVKKERIKRRQRS